MLQELAETEKVKGDNIKMNSYLKAARAVQEYDKVILNGKQAEKEIRGVGPGLTQRPPPSVHSAVQYR